MSDEPMVIDAPAAAAPEPAPRPYLSIAQIRAAKDMAEIDVEVPEWGGRVRVRPLNMATRRAVREVASSPKRQPDGSWGTDIDAEEMELEAIIQGCVEPAFKRGDKDWLREEKSAGPVNRIALAIFRISGMGVDAVGKPSADSEPTPS